MRHSKTRGRKQAVYVPDPDEDSNDPQKILKVIVRSEKRLKEIAESGHQAMMALVDSVAEIGKGSGHANWSSDRAVGEVQNMDSFQGREPGTNEGSNTEFVMFDSPSRKLTLSPEKSSASPTSKDSQVSPVSFPTSHQSSLFRHNLRTFSREKKNVKLGTRSDYWQEPNYAPAVRYQTERESFTPHLSCSGTSTANPSFDNAADRSGSRVRGFKRKAKDSLVVHKKAKKSSLKGIPLQPEAGQQRSPAVIPDCVLVASCDESRKDICRKISSPSKYEETNAVREEPQTVTSSSNLKIQTGRPGRPRKKKGCQSIGGSSAQKTIKVKVKGHLIDKGQVSAQEALNYKNVKKNMQKTRRASGIGKDRQGRISKRELKNLGITQNCPNKEDACENIQDQRQSAQHSGSSASCKPTKEANPMKKVLNMANNWGAYIHVNQSSPMSKVHKKSKSDLKVTRSGKKQTKGAISSDKDKVGVSNSGKDSGGRGEGMSKVGSKKHSHTIKKKKTSMAHNTQQIIQGKTSGNNGSMGFQYSHRKTSRGNEPRSPEISKCKRGELRSSEKRQAPKWSDSNSAVTDKSESKVQSPKVIHHQFPFTKFVLIDTAVDCRTQEGTDKEDGSYSKTDQSYSFPSVTDQSCNSSRGTNKSDKSSSRSKTQKMLKKAKATSIGANMKRSRGGMNVSGRIDSSKHDWQSERKINGKERDLNFEAESMQTKPGTEHQDFNLVKDASHPKDSSRKSPSRKAYIYKHSDEISLEDRSKETSQKNPLDTSMDFDTLDESLQSQARNMSEEHRTEMFSQCRSLLPKERQNLQRMKSSYQTKLGGLARHRVTVKCSVPLSDICIGKLGHSSKMAKEQNPVVHAEHNNPQICVHSGTETNRYLEPCEEVYSGQESSEFEADKNSTLKDAHGKRLTGFDDVKETSQDLNENSHGTPSNSNHGQPTLEAPKCHSNLDDSGPKNIRVREARQSSLSMETDFQARSAYFHEDFLYGVNEQVTGIKSLKIMKYPEGQVGHRTSRQNEKGEYLQQRPKFISECPFQQQPLRYSVPCWENLPQVSHPVSSVDCVPFYTDKNWKECRQDHIIQAVETYEQNQAPSLNVPAVDICASEDISASYSWTFENCPRAVQVPLRTSREFVPGPNPVYCSRRPWRITHRPSCEYATRGLWQIPRDSSWDCQREVLSRNQESSRCLESSVTVPLGVINSQAVVSSSAPLQYMRRDLKESRHTLMREPHREMSGSVLHEEMVPDITENNIENEMHVEMPYSEAQYGNAWDVNPTFMDDGIIERQNAPLVYEDMVDSTHDFVDRRHSFRDGIGWDWDRHTSTETQNTGRTEVTRGGRTGCIGKETVSNCLICYDNVSGDAWDLPGQHVESDSFYLTNRTKKPVKGDSCAGQWMPAESVKVYADGITQSETNSYHAPVPTETRDNILPPQRETRNNIPPPQSEIRGRRTSARTETRKSCAPLQIKTGSMDVHSDTRSSFKPQQAEAMDIQRVTKDSFTPPQTKARCTRSVTQSKTRSGHTNTQHETRSGNISVQRENRNISTHNDYRNRSTSTQSETRNRNTNTQSETRNTNTQSETRNRISNTQGETRNRSTSTESETRNRNTNTQSETRNRSTSTQSETRKNTSAQSETRNRSTGVQSETRNRSTSTQWETLNTSATLQHETRSVSTNTHSDTGHNCTTVQTRTRNTSTQCEIMSKSAGAQDEDSSASEHLKTGSKSAETPSEIQDNNASVQYEIRSRCLGTQSERRTSTGSGLSVIDESVQNGGGNSWDYSSIQGACRCRTRAMKDDNAVSKRISSFSGTQEMDMNATGEFGNISINEQKPKGAKRKREPVTVGRCSNSISGTLTLSSADANMGDNTNRVNRQHITKGGGQRAGVGRQHIVPEVVDTWSSEPLTINIDEGAVPSQDVTGAFHIDDSSAVKTKRAPEPQHISAKRHTPQMCSKNRGTTKRKSASRKNTRRRQQKLRCEDCRTCDEVAANTLDGFGIRDHRQVHPTSSYRPCELEDARALEGTPRKNDVLETVIPDDFHLTSQASSIESLGRSGVQPTEEENGSGSEAKVSESPEKRTTKISRTIHNTRKYGRKRVKRCMQKEENINSNEVLLLLKEGSESKQAEYRRRLCEPSHRSGLVPKGTTTISCQTDEHCNEEPTEFLLQEDSHFQEELVEMIDGQEQEEVQYLEEPVVMEKCQEQEVQCIEEPVEVQEMHGQEEMECMEQPVEILNAEEGEEIQCMEEPAKVKRTQMRKKTQKLDSPSVVEADVIRECQHITRQRKKQRHVVLGKTNTSTDGTTVQQCSLGHNHTSNSVDTSGSSELSKRNSRGFTCTSLTSCQVMDKLSRLTAIQKDVYPYLHEEQWASLKESGDCPEEVQQSFVSQQQSIQCIEQNEEIENIQIESGVHDGMAEEETSSNKIGGTPRHSKTVQHKKKILKTKRGKHPDAEEVSSARNRSLVDKVEAMLDELSSNFGKNLQHGPVGSDSEPSRDTSVYDFCDETESDSDRQPLFRQQANKYREEPAWFPFGQRGRCQEEAVIIEEMPPESTGLLRSSHKHRQKHDKTRAGASCGSDEGIDGAPPGREKTTETWQIGDLVWVYWTGQKWWPAIIVNPEVMAKKPAKPNHVWVYWFGDHLVSMVHSKKLESFSTCFQSRYRRSGRSAGALYQQSVVECLQVCVWRSGINLDPADKDALMDWAQDGFCLGEKERPDAFTPTEDKRIPEDLMNHLAEIKDWSLMQIRPSTSVLSDEYTVTQRDNLKLVREGQVKITEVCLCCEAMGSDVICQHPLFEGGLCAQCKGELVESLFAFDDDGSHVFCVICGDGGNLYICERMHCGNVYCLECIGVLVGLEGIRMVKETRSWHCFTCVDKTEYPFGLLAPKENKQQNIFAFFQSPELLNQSAEDLAKATMTHLVKQPIRVLSLFDGIGTAKYILDQLGIEVEAYYASEIDKDALLVTKVQHGSSVLQLGSVHLIGKEELEELGPIDLLIGGSPCNDLSVVNPARLGFSGGTGPLFFEFYRILHLLMQLNPDHHLFWLYENVVSMPAYIKASIDRFLQRKPAMWDAIYFSAQQRPRYFWGNIPGMHHPQCYVTEGGTPRLEDLLTPNTDRKAIVDKIRCVTTRTNSLLRGERSARLPVQMGTQGDVVWIQELEKVFGFPEHYTDVGNLPPWQRQQLLGRAWSVPVVKQLLKPLQQFFTTCSTIGGPSTKNEEVSS